MIKGKHNDRTLVVDILSRSFEANKSVNFVIRQGKNKEQRIRKLMEYSFDLCYLFGEVYLTEDKKACALIMFPDKQKTTLSTILLDAKLAIFCIGITRIFKVLKRNSIIKSNYPSSQVLYLWFIGVHPDHKGRGIGSALLNDIIKESDSMQRPIYLETSMKENLSFYKERGFEVYKDLDLSYKLFLIKREYQKYV